MYHVAEPADVSSEQCLGSWVVFACVIKAIVSVIKVWSSLHVPSGIRQMCVVFDSDAVVFQCTLACRENDNSPKRDSGGGGLQIEGSSFLLICDMFGLGVGGRYWVTRTP